MRLPTDLVQASRGFVRYGFRPGISMIGGQKSGSVRQGDHPYRTRCANSSLRVRLPRPLARSTSTRRASCRELRPPPTPHRPNELARSQAALARRAMIASRVSSLAAESETNAGTAKCRPSGRVIMPMSLVAEVMPLRVPPVPVFVPLRFQQAGRTCFWRSRHCVSAGESRARCKICRPDVYCRVA